MLGWGLGAGMWRDRLVGETCIAFENAVHRLGLELFLVLCAQGP